MGCKWARGFESRPFCRNSLDCNCKKWRLFADLLNDGAMLLELCIPYVTHLSMEVLCVSTAMKAVVSNI